MDKRNIYIAVAALALILIAVLIFTWNSETKNPENQVPRIGNTLSEQRESYGISKAVFLELPLPPNDFNKMVSMYHKNEFRDEFFFSEKYFLQPEPILVYPYQQPCVHVEVHLSSP